MPDLRYTWLDEMTDVTAYTWLGFDRSYMDEITLCAHCQAPTAFGSAREMFEKVWDVPAKRYVAFRAATFCSLTCENAWLAAKKAAPARAEEPRHPAASLPARARLAAP